MQPARFYSISLFQPFAGQSLISTSPLTANMIKIDNCLNLIEKIENRSYLGKNRVVIT
jgi:hypothetical protein